MSSKNLGWICLHRKIRDHWIWQDPIKLKWWLDIVLQVNHDKKVNKINIGLQIIDCGRGQTVMSLNNWSERWNVSRDSARHFLNLLQREGMIVMENLTISTRITVCNFDSCNKTAHDQATVARQTEDRLQTVSDTNNNNLNNNIKKVINNDTKVNNKKKNSRINRENIFSDPNQKSEEEIQTKDKLELKQNSDISLGVLQTEEVNRACMRTPTLLLESEYHNFIDMNGGEEPADMIEPKPDQETLIKSAEPEILVETKTKESAATNTEPDLELVTEGLRVEELKSIEKIEYDDW